MDRAICVHCWDGWYYYAPFDEPQGWSRNDVQYPDGKWACRVPCPYCDGPRCPRCGARYSKDESLRIDFLRPETLLCGGCEAGTRLTSPVCNLCGARLTVQELADSRVAAVRVEGRRVNIGKCAKCRQGEEGEVMDSLPCICVWCNRLMDADRKPLRPATAEERDEWTYRDETTGPEGCGLDGGKAGQGFCAECEAQGVPDPFAMPSVFCVECGHALTMEEYIVYLNECVRDLPSATLACAGCREGRR